MPKISRRLSELAGYPFAKLDQLKSQLIRSGAKLLDLSIGDPDLPTPAHILEALKAAVEDPATHRYPSYRGLPELRQAIADWYLGKEVKLDPDDQVLILIGSKEGIAHSGLALLDPGELALIPDPSYPVYRASVILAGGSIQPLRLNPELGFLPDLESLDSELLRRAKLLFLNYPNNPTAGVASSEFFKQVVDLALDHELIVLHDFAYSQICFDGYVAPSFLSIRNADQVGVEFHSFSKTYSMAGWRLGFMAGDPQFIHAIAQLKTHIDSGAFHAIQYAALEALRNTPESLLRERMEIYRKRRDLLAEALQNLGLEFKLPKATFYIWVKAPPGMDGDSYALELLSKHGILVAPGSGFGWEGRDYVRFSLTCPDQQIQQAAARLCSSDP